MKLDLDYLQAAGYSVRINDDIYVGRIAVGDTLEVNGIAYAVLGINEDAVIVKELSV